MHWGIDIGSRSIELVGMNGNTVVEARRLPTSYRPLEQIECILDGIERDDTIVVTGYGRKLFLDYIAWRGDKRAITEIQAYAVGAKTLLPEVRMVLDIGGQDTKAIALDREGRVVKFDMNDRCAAGTGKFLEFTAALHMPIEQFGTFALAATKNLTINSMCTVFAETEATSLMAQGERPEDIARALHQAIVTRTVAMLHRVGLQSPLLFAGGVARNDCVRRLLETSLGTPVIVPERPEFVGAMGAAVAGMDISR